MSGFVVLAHTNPSSQSLESNFASLLRETAINKQLDATPAIASGKNCIAAKLDSGVSIHTGIIHDVKTGSWLLAAGTVVALDGSNQPDLLLRRLLVEYVERGLKALDRFDGHFALVIYNGLEDSLSILSDAIGMFGIFYSHEQGRLLVSNSALAVASCIHAEPDALSAEHFLRTGRLDADKTMWQDVKRLHGSMLLQVKKGSVIKTQYWSPVFDEATSRLPLEDALDDCDRLFTQTFTQALTPEGKVWADLTGGFDSRMVAMFAEKANIPFAAYCMGPKDHSDVRISRAIAEAMAWEYVNSQLPPEWEPNQYAWFDTALRCGDARASTLRLAMTLRGFAERNTMLTTNLMGAGGENFRGFDWLIEKNAIGKTTRVNMEALLRKLYAGIPMHVMRQDKTAEVKEEMGAYIQQLTGPYAHYPNTVQLDLFEIYRDSTHGGAYLSANAKIGRSIAPFCFKPLINFAFSLNYRWKLPKLHLFIRAMFERENKRLADIETTTGGPALPVRLNNAHRFWPLWRSMANRAAALGTKKALRRVIEPWPPLLEVEYPLANWKGAFKMFALANGLLHYDSMCSKGLYRMSEFNQYLDHPAAGNHHHPDEFLDRVITIEMALRAVGTGID